MFLSNSVTYITVSLCIVLYEQATQETVMAKSGPKPGPQPCPSRTPEARKRYKEKSKEKRKLYNQTRGRELRELNKDKINLARRLKVAAIKCNPELNRQRLDVRKQKSEIVKQRTRKLLADFKSQGCKQCGEKFLEALECHHVDKTNKKIVTQLIHSGSTEKRIQKELDKCEVLCVNCHRKEHHKAIPTKHHNWRANYVRNLKQTIPCYLCGESDWRCLDFHHVRGEKIANISLLAICAVKVTKEQFFEEIAKCDIICANCHRKHHYGDHQDDD